MEIISISYERLLMRIDSRTWLFSSYAKFWNNEDYLKSSNIIMVFWNYVVSDFSIFFSWSVSDKNCFTHKEKTDSTLNLITVHFNEHFWQNFEMRWWTDIFQGWNFNNKMTYIFLYVYTQTLNLFCTTHNNILQ